MAWHNMPMDTISYDPNEPCTNLDTTISNDIVVNSQTRSVQFRHKQHEPPNWTYPCLRPQIRLEGSFDLALIGSNNRNAQEDKIESHSLCFIGRYSIKKKIHWGIIVVFGTKLY